MDKTTEHADATELRKQIQQKDGIIAQMKSDLKGMTASRDGWQRRAKVSEAQLAGKITPEWRAAYEAGAKPIEG